MTTDDAPNQWLDVCRRVQEFQRWAVYAGVSAPVAEAVEAPWDAEQVYRLNRRQEDPRFPTYLCPVCNVSLFATRGGWMCARRPGHFRQSWAVAEDIDQPYVPRPREES